MGSCASKQVVLCGRAVHRDRLRLSVRTGPDASSPERTGQLWLQAPPGGRRRVRSWATRAQMQSARMHHYLCLLPLVNVPQYLDGWVTKAHTRLNVLGCTACLAIRFTETEPIRARLGHKQRQSPG